MQDKIKESRMQDLAQEESARLTAREHHLRRYRELMQRQEHELEAHRARLKEEQLERERSFQKELEAREKFYVEREKSLIERQREFEAQLMYRQAEVESMRERLHQEITTREARLQHDLAEFKQEKERYSEESRQKIERTSKGYVTEALEKLDKKERQFHKISKVRSAVGAGALVLSIAFFAYVSLASAVSLPAEVTWEIIIFTVFKGLVAMGLLAGLARYAFLFSGSYMQEALKNADRRHAINFGKFYLESYGAAAEWSQVKEAFEHWNIAGSNAFSRADQALADANALEKAVALVERAGRSLTKENSGPDGQS